MRCNYLGPIERNVANQENNCQAGPSLYETTESDRTKYCETENFIGCPRLITIQTTCDTCCEDTCCGEWN